MKKVNNKGKSIRRVLTGSATAVFIAALTASPFFSAYANAAPVSTDAEETTVDKTEDINEYVENETNEKAGEKNSSIISTAAGSDAAQNTEEQAGYEENAEGSEKAGDNGQQATASDVETEEKKDPAETEETKAVKLNDVKKQAGGVGAVLQSPDIVSGSSEDNKGPEVKSVKFDKNEYEAGDTINVTVVADDKSGVNDGRVEIQLSGEEYGPIYLEKKNDTTLVGKIKTDNSWKKGTYKITELTVEDKDLNGTYYKSSLTDYEEQNGYKLISTINPPSIKITKSLEDREGPVITKISFDKNTYKPGDTVNVEVEATDPSGIFSLFESRRWPHRAGMVTVADSDGNEKSAELRIHEGGKITGSFKVTDAWKSGKYTVEGVIIFDESGNYSYYEDDNIDKINTGTFTVSGSKGDIAAPVVTSVSFDKKAAVPGDVVTVTANATDATGVDDITLSIAITEIKNNGYGDYTDVVDQKTVRIHKNAEGAFKGTLTVDDSWKAGTYKLYGLTATDVLGNSSGNEYSYLYETYVSNIKADTLTVSATKEDKEGPVIKSLTFDKKSVQAGGRVKVTAKATDVTGVKEIAVKVVNEKDNESYSGLWGQGVYIKAKELMLTKSGNDTWTGEYTIDDSWRNGKYTVEYIKAVDVLGNRTDGYGRNEGDDTDRSYSNKNNLFGISFTVSGSKEDIKGPVIKSVTVDKETVRPGEDITFIIEMEDENGLDPYIPVFSIATRDYYSYLWSGDFEGLVGNKYILKTKVINAAAPGVYTLSELLVRDLLGNVSYFVDELIREGVDDDYYYTYMNRKIDNGVSVEDEVASVKNNIRIRIVDTTEEYNGPEIKTLKLDKTKINQYTDKLTITATVAKPSVTEYINVMISKDSIGKSDSYYVEMKKHSDGSFKGEIVADDMWTPGEYYIQGLYSEDKDSNRFEVGYDRTNTDKKVEDVIIGSDRFEVVKNDITISLDKKLLVLDKGKSGKLIATVKPAGVIDKTVTWSSSDNKVATVDENGNVTAVNHGTAKITATKNGKTAACEVRVNFADVASTSMYYYNPVYWAAEKGITTGANGLFAPHSSCTREHAITFLWRMAGSPQPKSMVSKFRDIQNKNSYSYKAIMWGTEKGIITGSGGVFAPNNSCTREQIVTMLWRLAGKPLPKSTSSKFKDVQNKNAYSYNAILWASEKGITTGANGEFKPGKTCTRAEIVTFIYRYKNTMK